MKRFAICLIALAVAVPAAATPFNVAFGKTVTATKTLGVIATAPWPDATVFPVADLSTLVDGVFRPEGLPTDPGTPWQDGTIWWDEANPGSVNNWLEIDLDGLFEITWLKIQADNNDRYQVNYRDALGNWIDYGYLGPYGGAGMRTREGILPAVPSFVASALRIDAFLGDGLYSISEFQATGTPVPEPASAILLATGLVAAARRYRRRAR